MEELKGIERIKHDKELRKYLIIFLIISIISILILILLQNLIL